MQCAADGCGLTTEGTGVPLTSWWLLVGSGGHSLLPFHRLLTIRSMQVHQAEAPASSVKEAFVCGRERDDPPEKSRQWLADWALLGSGQ